MSRLVLSKDDVSFLTSRTISSLAVLPMPISLYPMTDMSPVSISFSKSLRQLVNLKI